ncbi:MAG TPA: glycosyltransferase family 2 protein [Candidatus Bathyarchaeia archaeon]|nr:glycosyltransferase family 2 protein [Candidatus Bathyarchaeia archaeon]
MNNKIGLSVIIIVRNEEAMIADALKSVNWAEEIIVFDTGSSDKTAQVARDTGVKVFQVPFRGYNFSKWRNQALKRAGENWILYLDADERVTPLLKKEIQKVVKNKISAYAISRRNFYLGKEMHYGGAWPDDVIRLFHRQDLIRWVGELHEQPVISGKIGKLKNPLIHLTHRDLSSMMEKTIDWTVIEAELLFASNHPRVAWWRILRMMVTKFWKRIVLQQAWRDGTEGWINALFEVGNTFIIYARLWEMQNKA